MDNYFIPCLLVMKGSEYISMRYEKGLQVSGQ